MADHNTLDSEPVTTPEASNEGSFCIEMSTSDSGEFSENSIDNSIKVAPIEAPSNDPIVIDETSIEPKAENLPNETNRCFSFQVESGLKLKRAIAVLCDSEFNESGLGFIHVDENGFEIAVVNNTRNDTGVLSLLASCLINFHCRNPILEAKFVILTEVSERLTGVDDNDTPVTVFQVDGSAVLSFELESDDAFEEFSVDLMNTSEIIGKLSRTPLYYCKAIVPTQVLARMTERCIQGKVVSVEIENEEARFEEMDEEIWEYHYEKIKTSGMPGDRPGQIHRAWFEWSYAKALKMASGIKIRFDLCLRSSPTRDVMFVFHLGGLGQLLILKETLAIYPDADVHQARARD